MSTPTMATYPCVSLTHASPLFPSRLRPLKQPSTAEEEEDEKGMTTVVAALKRTYEDGGLRALFQGM